MKTLFIILILCFINPSIFAQKDVADLSYVEIDSIVNLNYKQQNYQLCITHTEVVREKAKKEFGEVDSTYNYYTKDLGFFYQEVGLYKKAKKLLLESKGITEKRYGKNHSEYSLILTDLGGLYQLNGEYIKSEQTYLEAAKINEKILDKSNPDYTAVLNNLGALYQLIGKYPEAEKLFKESATIQKKYFGSNNSIYATSLNNLAVLYNTVGKYQEAEKLYLLVKSIDEKTVGKTSLDYAANIYRLAALYQEMDKYQEAENYYSEVLTILENTLGNNHPKYALTLANIASLQEKTNEIDKAAKTWQKVLEIQKKALGINHPNYAVFLTDVASFEKRSNNLNSAQKLYKEALVLMKKSFGTENPKYANLLMNTGALFFQLDSIDLALKYTIESIASNSATINSGFSDFASLDQHNYYSNQEVSNSIKVLLKILIEQYKKSNDSLKLNQYYAVAKAAINVNKKIKKDVSSNKDKLRVLASNNTLVCHGIRGALLLRENKYKKEAFSFAEQNKSILLADAIKGNRARNLGDLPDSLVFQEIKMQKELSELQKQEYETQSEEEKNAVNNELARLQLDIDDFIKSIKNKYPKYHALKYENITAKAEDIQALLDDETLLLEYFLSDSIIYLFGITKDKVQLYPISISKSVLKEKISTLRQALTNYNQILKNPDKSYNKYTQSAHWFYQNILAIALKEQEVKNLIIITDGELGHLPFETFLTTAAPQGNEGYQNLHYLMKDYNINYNYSATLWKENKNAPALSHNNQLLAVAADYKPIDSIIPPSRLPQELEIRKLLQPLAAAQEEVKTLAKYFNGNFLFGKEANEKTFKSQAQNYGVIHLAMHGILDNRTPMLSSLAFTEDSDSLENNFLQAYEISRLNLNADLVVLSACETGYGDFEQGEGIVSLARSFMYAGTPSLVVSLWQVNDQSTSLIMQSFYQYLADGLPKDVALRQAKLDFIAKAERIAAHPAFWSPFIQLGDTKAIQLKTKANWIPWGIGIGVLVLGLGGFVILKRKK